VSANSQLHDADGRFQEILHGIVSHDRHTGKRTGPSGETERPAASPNFGFHRRARVLKISSAIMVSVSAEVGGIR